MRPRTFGMLKLLAILSVLCALAHSEKVSSNSVSIGTRELASTSKGTASGESKGSWVLLGSMCFDANTEDEITVVATGLAEGSNQRILFYDDESGSFAKAVSAPSCKAKVDEAKPLSFLDKYGNPVTIKGVNLPVKGQKVTQKIKITEKYKHQWYFVASNCGDTVETEKSVKVDFQITASQNVECSALFHKPSIAGYIVGCIFMVTTVLILALVSYCFYRKSKPPTMPTVKDNTGYNEL